VLVLGVFRGARWRLLLAEYAAVVQHLLEQQAQQVLVVARAVVQALHQHATAPRVAHLARHHGLQVVPWARRMHQWAEPMGT
jgi:hypothetical protein